MTVQAPGGDHTVVSAASTIDRLSCSWCQKTLRPNAIAFLCECGAPLLASYRIEEAARTLTRKSLRDRPPTMWRYREMLPGSGEPVSLGEGLTPLHHARGLGGQELDL